MFSVSKELQLEWERQAHIRQFCDRGGERVQLLERREELFLTGLAGARNLSFKLFTPQICDFKQNLS